MNQKSPTSHLEALVGTWTMEAVFPGGAAPGGAPTAPGETIFEWGPNQAFLVQRWQVPHPAAPDGVAVLAAEGTDGSLVQHYFDSRGVVRRYAMGLDDKRWTLLRLHPGFCQRFAGKFSDDGNVIDGAWEGSDDGWEWTLDFRLIYRKTA